MFLIDTSRNGQSVYNALVNQSLDAYLINDLHLEGHGLICYINDPAVIIGRYQNAYAEVNLNYMKEHQIQLVRRTSGGGAVYHDRGNVIFENIVVGDTSGFRDFQRVGAPIVDALHDLGIKDAEVRGRNDMAINGKKFSGMAMVKKGDAYAAGGTLMFDLNGEVASTVLTPDIGKLEAKGIKSVDARITNIKPYLPAQYQSWTSEDFKNYLLCHLFGVERLADIPTYHLTDQDWAAIDARLDNLYGTDEWNYGHNPGFSHYVSHHFPIGTVSFNFNVENRHISEIRLFGDFFTTGDPHLIEAALVGVEYSAEAIKAALSKVDIEQNLSAVSVDELTALLMRVL